MLESLLLPQTEAIVDGPTQLLMHFDSGITDVKGHQITTFNNPAINTTRAKFGAGSLLFTAQQQLIRVAASNDLIFSGDFTVEFFLNRISTANINLGLFAVDSADGILLQYSNGSLYLYDAKTTSGATAAVAIAPFAPAINTWVHVATVRFGNNWYIYSEGNRIASGVSSLGNVQALPFIVNGLRSRGASPSYAYSNTLFYMDEFAVTNGTAKYTGTTYTPPTQPLT